MQWWNSVARRTEQAEELAWFGENYPGTLPGTGEPVEHPLVRVHPETQQPCLYISPQQITDIRGMDAAESSGLLAELNALCNTPEFQCRFHWTENSLALWDNRCCQHYGVSDYWPQRRVVERVTIAGTAPVPVPVREGAASRL